MTSHTARAHAKLSPSAAHRWFECPGSIRLSQDVPSKSSIYADEGTAAHELSQHCLSSGHDAARFLGGFVDLKAKQPGNRFLDKTARSFMEGKARVFEITDEMVESVQTYLDEVRQFRGDGWEYEIEAKLDLRHIPGMEFGTGDFVAYNAEQLLLVVRDFKYGKGVPVEVEGNEQLLVYAEGTAKRFHNRGLDKIDIGIVQPRCPHPRGPVRTHTIDAVDLVEFRFTLEEKAQRTAQAAADWDKAELVGALNEWGTLFLAPGDWCRFCPAAPTCPALRSHALQTAEMEFSDTPPVVADLDVSKLAEVMTKAPVIEDWLKRCKERAHELAAESKFPGFKLVHSTSHRKWKDDGATATHLMAVCDLDEADIYTEPKVKSPAQVEKLLGAKRKGEIADLVYKPPGKVILVPESDPREPAKVSAETEFGE